jgi:hypothetical protein
MAHRPYPDRDRALRQLHRHDPRRSEVLTPPEWRGLGEASGRNGGGQARPQWWDGSGVYRMSTR